MRLPRLLTHDQLIAFFDAEWYVAKYPDVAQSRVDPLRHYLDAGRYEGRAPTREAHELRLSTPVSFDAEWYASCYTDVADSGMEPEQHYLLFGRSEGRAPNEEVFVSQQKQLQNSKADGIPQNVAINIPITDRFLASLQAKSDKTPEVSIVILSYKRPDLVENLVKSIWLFTGEINYEIIVVDNGSGPGNHYLSQPIRSYTTVITLHENKYIGDAYNIGVEAARGEFVVLMNNDIVVQPGWLFCLLARLKTSRDIGLVGPKFIYPNGVLQEAGALIDAQGFSVQLGKRGRALDPEFNFVREVDYCTGATVSCRRDFFLDVLGYDWRWTPGYYEDSDLAFKARDRGLKSLYEPDAVVFHLESVTMSTLPPTQHMAEAIGDNRRRFVEKWAHLLNAKQDASSSGNSRVVTAEEGLVFGRFQKIQNYQRQHKKTAAFFFPFEFVPGGGEKYLLSIAEQLADGADLFFIFPGIESILRVMSVTADLGFPSLVFAMLTWGEAQKFGKFDMFFMLGNELFPSRAGLGHRNFFNCQFPFPTTHEYLSYCYDNKFHESYECYFVNSEYTKSFITERFSAWFVDIPVHILPPTTDLIGLGADCSEADASNRVLGVGRFFTGSHNKHHDKMIEALKIINAQAPSLELSLHLAGAVHREPRHKEHLRTLRKQAEGLNVEFHVDIPRAKLNELYQSGKVYWHAAGWGVDSAVSPEQAEHFGITIVEAMSAGCIPIVFAVGGPIEIVRHGINGFTVGSIEEMADWTIRLLREWQTPFVQNIRAKAIDTAAQFGKIAFAKRAKEIFLPDAPIKGKAITKEFIAS